MAKLKLSVTLSPDLVARIDRVASRTPGSSRSAIMERWLLEGSRRDAARQLDLSTAAYYDGLTAAEQAEGDEWASYAAAHFPAADEPAGRAAERGLAPRRRR